MLTDGRKVRFTLPPAIIFLSLTVGYLSDSSPDKLDKIIKGFGLEGLLELRAKSEPKPPIVRPELPEVSRNHGATAFANIKKTSSSSKSVVPSPGNESGKSGKQPKGNAKSRHESFLRFFLGLVGGLIGLSIGLLSLGYVLGTINFFLGMIVAKIFFARACVRACSNEGSGKKQLPRPGKFDSWLSPRAYGQICDYYKIKNEDIPTINEFALASHFLHSEFDKTLYDWTIRRWVGFQTSASSALAILLSFFAGLYFFSISLSWVWCSLVAIVFISFLHVAYKSWKETMDMIETEAYIKTNPDYTPASKKEKATPEGSDDGSEKP